jgi:zinc/manganese transport system substrate-binding protein
MKTRLTLTLAAATLALAACGSGSTDTATTAAPADAKIPVVASTDVWGAVATAVGGDRVEVTSLIDSPDQDPHEFEATPADAATVAKASLVLVNGGGYDDFATKLVQAAGTNPPVIDAVDVSGLDTGGAGEFNEHVWYSLPTVDKVADAIATQLGQASPADAATFTANAQRFHTDVAGLQSKVDAIGAAHAGQPIAVTEPVPLYLTEAAGLRNATPEEFSEAVEEGNDPAAAVLSETLDVIPTVKALVANSQTENPSTQKVEDAATAANVPVVTVSETLPEGVDSYVAWQSAQLDDLAKALGTAG